MERVWQRLLTTTAKTENCVEAISRLAAEMACQIGAASCCLSLNDCNDEFARLIILESVERDLAKGIYFLAEQSFVSRVDDDLKPYSWTEACTESPPREVEMMGCRSALAFPLQVGGKLLGTLSLGGGIAPPTSAKTLELQLMAALVSSLLAEHLAQKQREEDASANHSYQRLALSIETMGRQRDLSLLLTYAAQAFRDNLEVSQALILLEKHGKLSCSSANVGELPQFSLPIPVQWRGPQSNYEVYEVSSNFSYVTKLFPLVQGQELLGAVHVKASRTTLADPKQRRVLDILLSSLASCLKTKLNYAEAVGMRKAAERANHAKTAFLANISHEIRTPLNSIVGLSSLMRDQSSNGEHRELLNTIVRSAAILKSVIHDLLDLSRMESGHIELTEEPVEIRQLVEQCLEIVDGAAKEKQLKIEYHIDSVVPKTLITDETRLTQILLNLLSNAVKFSDEGVIRLSADYEVETQIATFRVVDSGIGLPVSCIQRVFEPFFQVSNSLAENRGGTGLGLSICHQLATLMKGSISAESVLGKGSCFKVQLPLATVDEPAAESKEPVLTRERPSFLDCKIVFVDDNELNRITGRTLLNTFCKNAIIASSGMEAVSIAERESPDVILMDISMPDIDGLEATRRIRSLKLESQPHIIAVSGHIQDSYKEQAFEAGLNAFLEKPYTVEKLRQTIETAIAGRSACEQNVASDQLAAL